MALDYLDKQLENLRKEAALEQSSLRSRTEGTLADRTLSDEGKREQVSALETAARARLKALQDEEIRLAAAQLQDLTRRVTGSTGTDPSAIIAFRDAQDRAEALDDRHKAATMLDRALTSGDKSLAAAIMRRAVESNWTEVFDKYAAAHPTAAENVKDMNQLSYFLNSTQHAMERAFIYGS